MHHNIPSVNSLMSAYVCLERTIVFGGLKSIQKRLGDRFPCEYLPLYLQLKTEKTFTVIDQTMYSSHRDMIITPSFPLVGKVASTHAGTLLLRTLNILLSLSSPTQQRTGYGKMRLKDGEEFQDFKSLCALHGDYVTVEVCMRQRKGRQMISDTEWHP